MGRNQFLNKHQFLRMSREELERKWKAQKLMEQEEMLLMEAKARALQYVASSAAGGTVSVEPEIVTLDIGAVLFLDTTWKYLYLDYKNGTISDPIDTQVPATYQYYMRDISGPIQDKGLVYVLSENQNPFDSEDPTDISVVHIGVNGELVDTKYIIFKLGDLTDDTSSYDGLAHMTIKNNGLSSVVSIFNGIEIISKEYQVLEGYEFMQIFSGSSQDSTAGGRVFIYKLYFAESESLAEIVSIDPETGQETILFSDDIFSIGEPSVLMYYPGSIFYIGFYEPEAGYLFKMRGYDAISGSMVFNLDFDSDIPGSVLGNSDFIFYGKNNMQVMLTYDDGISEKARIYNFDGDSGEIVNQDIEGFSDFDDVVIRRSSIDPYLLHSYTESEGIANIFYAGEISDGLMTVPDLCVVYYLLKGESSYRTYVVRASGDPERSINLNWGDGFLSLGRDLYIECDLGDVFGLSGNLSLVNLGSTVNVIETGTTTDIMEGLALFPSGDNSLYLISQNPLYEALLLGPEGVVIDQITTELNEIRISGGPGFLLTPSASYYWNGTSSGFQELSGFNNADAPEYATPDRMASGNLMIFNSDLSPVNYLLASNDSLGNQISLDQEAGGYVYLGKSTFFYLIKDTSIKLYLYDLSGNLLQSYEESGGFEAIDAVGMVADKLLGIRRVTEESRVDVFIGSSAGIAKSTINGLDYQIIPMINDMIWFDQYFQPGP